MSCEAKRQGIVRVRGKSSIEWHKDGKPQYYCYGCIDCFTKSAKSRQNSKSE